MSEVNSKNRLLRWARELTIIVVVLVGVFAWQSRHLLDDDGSELVSPVSLVTLAGDTATLPASDRNTLLYFFAPWCQVCELSIGNLEGLDSDSLQVIRVALDYQAIGEVAEFVERTEITGKVLLGTQSLKQRFQLRGYPTYYLVDRDQRIVGGSVGYSSSWGMKLANYLHLD